MWDDGSGSLSFSEFVAAFKRDSESEVANTDEEQQWRRYFWMYDKDEDGSMSGQELKELLKNLLKLGEESAESHSEQYMKQFGSYTFRSYVEVFDILENSRKQKF